VCYRFFAEHGFPPPSASSKWGLVRCTRSSRLSSCARCCWAKP
jgi:hypothetical protein